MSTLSIGLIAVLASAVGIAAGSAALSRWLRWHTRGRRVRSLEEVPAYTRIVVLGCRPRLRSGRPNPYLIGRVASAAAAFHHTPGRRVLCTGLFDEATAMLVALEAASVPRSEVDLDEDSGRTIESIDFVAARHKDENILLVTQPFHMPRALFLARARGLEAWGLIASGPSPGVRSRVRERLAEFRAVFDQILR